MNRFIGYSQVVNTINYNTLKITVTVPHKIKSSMSACLVIAWSVEFSVRLKSPGPKSRLLCSANCLQDMSLTHTYIKHMSRDCYAAIPLACWLLPSNGLGMDLQKTHVRWRLPTVVVWCHHGHEENTAPVLLTVCVFQMLPINGFTCHNMQ
jgi:hypothetical protein